MNPKCICLIKGKFHQYLQWQPESKEFKLRKATNIFNFYELMTSTSVRFGLRSKSIVQTVVLTDEKIDHLYEHYPELKRNVLNLR